MCLVLVHRDKGLTAFLFSVILTTFLFFAISRKTGLGFTLGIFMCLALERIWFGFRN